MLLHKTALTAILALAYTNVANAEGDNHELSVGLGAIYISDHYVGDNDESLAVPLVTFASDRLTVGVLEGISYSVYKTGDLKLNLLAKPRYTSLDDPSSDELQGIDRSATLDLGLGAEYAFGQNFVSASFLAEVTGEHDGFEVDAKIGRIDFIGDVGLAYAVGAAWQSDDLANYQFGVRASEALASRPAFAPDAGVTAYVEALAEYRFRENWAIEAGAQFAMLTGDAKDSPIVDSDTSYAVFIGIVRKF